MNTWVRRSLKAGALTAGAVMATGTAAYADTTLISADNTGILNGTQVFAPIQAPINLCGVAAAIGGTATAGCEGGSAASIKGLYDVKMISAGNTGILNGTQIYAPIQAPINICGVAAAVLGKASAGCEGGASATQGGGHHHKNCKHDCKDVHHYSTESTPNAEVLGGLPVVGGLPVLGGLTQNLPLVGNLTKGGLTQSLPLVGPLLGGVLGGGLLGGSSLLGGGSADAVDIDALDSVDTMPRTLPRTESEGDKSDGGQGGGKPGCGTNCPPPPPPPPAKPCPPEHGHGKDVKLISTDNTGILNGTQIYAPIQIPIDVSGVAVGVLGKAAAWSTGGSSARM